MEEIAKKILQKEDEDPVHIGNMVQWEIEHRRVMKKEVAAKLGIIPTTLNQYFKQPSLQTTILWRLSRALNFNFLMYLGQKLEIDFQTDKEKELQGMLKQNQEEIETLKTQLDVYKQIHKIDDL